MEIRITASFDHKGKTYNKSIILDSKKLNSDSIVMLRAGIVEKANRPHVPTELDPLDAIKKIFLLLISTKRVIDLKNKKALSRRRIKK